MNPLVFFETPKADLKIQMLYRDEAELARIAAANSPTLPDADAYYTTIQFPPAPADRPYTYSSMVLSSDGKMAYEDNPAGPLVAKNNYLDAAGSLGDFWVLNVLRAASDGVIVGANTLAKEAGITCHVYDADLSRQRRENLGKPDQPVNVVVSFDGTDVPLDHYSFHVDPAERFRQMIATSPAGLAHIQAASPLRHTVWGPFTSRADIDAFAFPALDTDFDCFPILVTGEDNRPDSGLMLYALRKLGLERLCVESPSYCAHLMDQGWLDEYFINYSMVFAGGTITPGMGTPQGHESHPHARLLSVGTHRGSFLYTRQQLHYGVSAKSELADFHY